MPFLLKQNGTALLQQDGTSHILLEFPPNVGGFLTEWTPSDLFRESSLGFSLGRDTAVYARSSGAARGLSFQKLIQSQLKEYYNGIWFVPDSVNLGVGLTFIMYLTDDGTARIDLGRAVRLEVTPYNFGASGAPVDWSLSTSKGTPTAGTATLSATSGAIVVLSIPIVAANLAGLTADSVLGMRLRRLGDDVADTCLGRVICLGGFIANS